jgi:tetratricopeptide (TPR) repeat protein
MSTFQLLLFIITIIVFVLFFKQLFSGAFPKRGLDFETNRDNEQIGSRAEVDRSFSTPPPRESRVEQLVSMADRAIKNSDFVEADKALSSALILEKENIELLLKHGFVLINLNRLSEAKETYMDILDIDPNEDMALVSLANVLHKLGDNESSIEYHKRAIEIDSLYAPHYFNYANTLYYTGDREGALLNYKKALKIDSSLEEAQRMVKELS